MAEIRFVELWLPFRTPAMVVWPNTIFVQRNYYLNLEQLAHELRHVEQLNRLGWPRYIIGYLAQWLLHGHSGHPWEEEAREAESDLKYLEWAKRVRGYSN